MYVETMAHDHHDNARSFKFIQPMHDFLISVR